MLKYMIIPLSYDAVSFCHYMTEPSNMQSISSGLLKIAIIWAMKKDMSIQFLYPRRTLPKEIIELTESVDHVRIVPSDVEDNELLKKAEIVVFNSWQDMSDFEYSLNQSYVIRTTFEELLVNGCCLKKVLKNILCNRINVVFIDFNIRQNEYENVLLDITQTIIEEYKHGHQVQLNILTDRLMLTEMNNCNAGIDSLTLSPDGNFYVCPAFWIEGATPIGDLQNGLNCKNHQLYQLSHAPICRECDAWQCKRCVWLNKKLTQEVNTPSHEQCVISHVERNVSRYLLEGFRSIDSSFMEETQILEIDYLDPFDKVIKKR